MALKKPSERYSPTSADADALADLIADRPYGKKNESELSELSKLSEKEELIRTSIVLSKSLQQRIEDLALKNKRSGINPKSFSAIARIALEDYLTSNK